jgi:hypothetical protein
MPFKPSESLLPLTPISFEILLALLEADLHGYAILQAVEARLAGKLPLRTGTMYRALARLMDEGLIERSGTESPLSAARPRRPRRAASPTRSTPHARTACFRGRGGDAARWRGVDPGGRRPAPARRSRLSGVVSRRLRRNGSSTSA